jgi:hypothetical protein
MDMGKNKSSEVFIHCKIWGGKKNSFGGSLVYPCHSLKP